MLVCHKQVGTKSMAKKKYLLQGNFLIDVPLVTKCNIMAKGFRFMPLGFMPLGFMPLG